MRRYLKFYYAIRSFKFCEITEVGRFSDDQVNVIFHNKSCSHKITETWGRDLKIWHMIRNKNFRLLFHIIRAVLIYHYSCASAYYAQLISNCALLSYRTIDFFAGDKRKALFDFTSVNDDELDFSQGDIIEVRWRSLRRFQPDNSLSLNF